jgi:Zn-finger nucleic acid-binding protein
MTERQGIEIDYCPTCRGVWLDRGELDKILERSTTGAPQPSQPGAYDPRMDPRYDPRNDPRNRRDDDDDDDRRGRRGWLFDLFD